MKNRDLITHPEKIAKVLELAIKIQNKGIGTAFFEFSGHVSGVTVRTYLGSWTSDSAAAHEAAGYVGSSDGDTGKCLDTMIAELEDFISHHDQ